MIYILAAALALTIFGFIRRVRVAGFLLAVLDMTVAAAFGWLSGILIGIGARVGMWAIPVFNGGTPHITACGTVQVILVFSGYGVVLGLIYEALFRELLRQRGLLFGALIMLCTWYPLGAAGVQLLNFQPPLLPLIIFTGLILALTFVPYGLALEMLLRRWHRWRDWYWNASVPLAMSANHEESFISQN